MFNSGIVAQTITLPEVNSILFKGNNSIPNHKLKEVIFSKETPFFIFKWLYKISPSIGNAPEYFDSLLLAKDVRNLENLYKSEGFFKTEIEYKTNRDKDYVDILFLINEKEQAKFNKIVKNNFHKLEPKFLTEINEENLIDSNQYFSAEAIKLNNSNTISTLKNNGYLFAEFAKPYVLIDTNKNIVDLTLSLSSGYRYKYSQPKVIVKNKNNSYVDKDLTIKLSGVKQDDWYNEREIRLGEIRLYRTDLFNSSTTKISKIDSINKTVEISIETDTKLRNDISPEIIANNEDNVFNFGLSVGFLRRNFFNDARKLSLQLSATAQEPHVLLSNLNKVDSLFYGYVDARIGFEQPFLFDRQIYTKFETYYTIQNRRSEYFSNIFGIKLGLEFTLPKWVYLTGLGTNIRYQNSTYKYNEDYVYNLFKNYIINNLPSSEQQAALDDLKNQDLSNIESTGNNLFIGINILKNATNDFLFPTSGYSISFLLEDGNNIAKAIRSVFTNNLPQPGYIKLVGTTTYYPEVFSTFSSTLGLKLKLGEIYNLSGLKSDIPLDERLYVGGSNSVRGWRNRELVPSNAEVNISSSNPNDLEAIMLRNFAPGGFSLIEGSVEYRSKLIGDFGGATFVDWGNTWLDISNFRWDEIAIASGFGLRFYTQFFPLRFDVAFKVYDPYDRRSFFNKSIFKETTTFHIGIGEAF